MQEENRLPADVETGEFLAAHEQIVKKVLDNQHQKVIQKLSVDGLVI